MRSFFAILAAQLVLSGLSEAAQPAWRSSERPEGDFFIAQYLDSAYRAFEIRCHREDGSVSVHLVRLGQADLTAISKPIVVHILADDRPVKASTWTRTVTGAYADGVTAVGIVDYLLGADHRLLFQLGDDVMPVDASRAPGHLTHMLELCGAPR